jgi:Putative Actinobacterial Holin-X, holin superfamily III
MSATQPGDRLTVPEHQPVVEGRSTGELLSQVADDLSTLMRQEVDLAKAEVKQEVTKAAKGAGMLGGAGVSAHLVLVFGSLTVWAALANVMDEAWAGLLVTLAWAVVAAVLAVTGRARVKRINPKPERTIETLHEVPDALKGR